MKTSRLACLAIASVLTCGSLARAESAIHIDELAATAERQARQVLYQTYRLHGCGPAAQQLRSRAFQIIRHARHIHEVAHVDHHSSYRYHGYRGVAHRIDRQAHLNRDLAALDRLVHEMQDLVLELQSRTVVQRPVYNHPTSSHVGVSIGRGFSININSRGNSRYHHYDSVNPTSLALDRIQISLAELTDTVHHLLEDTGVVCVGRR